MRQRHGVELVGDGMADHAQYRAAARDMYPPLGMPAFWIVALIDVTRERGVAGIRCGSSQGCIAAVAELGLIANPAVRAGDAQHVSAPTGMGPYHVRRWYVRRQIDPDRSGVQSRAVRPSQSGVRWRCRQQVWL